ncbi:MAG: hypothetical protein ACRYFR_02470 [Janthinobacterium lividum]
MLTLLAGRAAAQVAPPPLRPEAATASATPAAPADTVAALHQLFAERRRRRTIIVGVTGGLTVAAVVGVASDNRGSGDLSAAVAVIFGILGGSAVTSELLFFRKYSPAKEQRAVERFQAHRLDPDLRRKLKPRFFR